MKIMRLVSKIPKTVLVPLDLVFWVFSGILLGHSELLSNIEIAGISSLRNTMVNFFPKMATWSTGWLFISIPLALLFCVAFFYKPVLLVIMHVRF